jgi:hypothetical protein
MTKRIPDKREQKRVYEPERSEQARRMKAIQMIVDGRTFREAATATQYAEFYDKPRPHLGIGLRTPDEAYGHPTAVF